MPLEKLVFATAVEGLFVRGLGAKLKARARERLKAAGLDLGRRLEVVYSLKQWKTFVRIAAEEVYPHLSPAEAHWRLGEHFLEGYLQTYVGRVMLGLAQALGPRLALARIGQDFQSGNNFSEVHLVKHEPGHLELWFNDVLSEQPAFAAGFIARAQQVAGARNVHVEVLGFDGAACSFSVSWEEGASSEAAAWPEPPPLALTDRARAAALPRPSVEPAMAGR
jgi:uncharacterized protein (TIGR02265 family)